MVADFDVNLEELFFGVDGASGKARYSMAAIMKPLAPA